MKVTDKILYQKVVSGHMVAILKVFFFEIHRGSQQGLLFKLKDYTLYDFCISGSSMLENFTWLS